MENSDPQSEDKNIKKWQLVNLSMELGFIIALPLVAMALAGKWLDGKLGTEPWLTVAGILLAIVATTIWISKKLKVYIK